MANGWLLDQEIDMQQPVSMQYTVPQGIVMTGDDRAQRLRYTVYDGQTAASLSGTLKAYYRRPDNTLIETTSGGAYVAVSSNVVTVQPPPEAYAQKGIVECIVKLYASDGKVITLARCDLHVEHGVSQDDTVIPAGEASRASLEERVAAIEAATGVVPIDQLPTLSRALVSSDYLITDDGTGPYKLTGASLVAALVSVTTSAGLTGATGVTVNNQVKLSIGKLRVYEIVFSTTASIAADANLVTGFDTQMLGANGVALVGPLFNNGAHNDPRVGYLSTGNALCCTTAFGSGDSRRCTVVYIAQ